MDRWQGASTGMRVALAIALPVAALVVVGVALPYEVIARLDTSNRLPVAARWGIAAIVFVIVVGVIGTTSANNTEVAHNSPGATSTASAAAAQSNFAGSDASPTSTAPAPTDSFEQLTDAEGDLVRADGLGARGPEYMDIVLVGATFGTEALTLRLELGGTPPTVDPVENEISYGFYLDLDADDEPNYQVLISNIEGGGEFVASLMLVSADEFGDAVSPDSVTVDDGVVEIQIPVEAVGNPASLSIAAFSEWTFYDDSSDSGFDQVIDSAPDVIWPEEGATWLVVH